MSAQTSPAWCAIDWSRPWLAALRVPGEALARHAEAVGLHQALNAATGPEHRLASGRLRFVEPSALPSGEPYETFIARSACVPTREHLHDFFNALIWLTRPRWKQCLNELQAEQISRNGVAGARGALRDALTLFDENAALLQAPPALVEALSARDWPTLFIERRALWVEAHLSLFGHALLEKLTRPRKAITAHVWVLPASPAGDEEALAAVTVERLTGKPFLPLPVLGVPGWWPANEAVGFYDDTAVFRPMPATDEPNLASKKIAARRPLF